MRVGYVFTLLGAGAVFFSGGFLLAQEKQQNNQELALELLTSPYKQAKLDALPERDAQEDKRTPEAARKERDIQFDALHKRTLELYVQAANDPVLATECANELMRGYYISKQNARIQGRDHPDGQSDLMQMQALQVVQNARIIQLLSELTKQKK